MKQSGQGNLLLISGPMFSGKSDELIKLHNQFLEEKKYTPEQILVVKPSKDIRTKEIFSRAGKKLDNVHPLAKSNDILNLVKNKTQTKVIFIDEFQFFDEGIISVINKLKKEKYLVIAAGLDKDFRKIDFPIYAKLLEHVDFHIMTCSICVVCGSVSKYTQRLVNGQPASKKSTTIEIELTNSITTYRAVCEKCHK